MSLSFAAVRTARVNAGLATNAQSERRMNPDAALCIASNWQDSYGRPAHPNSIIHTDPFCPFDPELRIDPENAQRPAYHQYLNTHGITLEEDVVESQLGQGYDAMLGGAMMPGRQQYFGRTGVYQLPAQQFQTESQDEALRNSEIYNRALRTRFNSTRYTNCSGNA